MSRTYKDFLHKKRALKTALWLNLKAFFSLYRFQCDLGYKSHQILYLDCWIYPLQSLGLPFRVVTILCCTSCLNIRDNTYLKLVRCLNIRCINQILLIFPCLISFYCLYCVLTCSTASKWLYCCFTALLISSLATASRIFTVFDRLNPLSLLNFKQNFKSSMSIYTHVFFVLVLLYVLNLFNSIVFSPFFLL